MADQYFISVELDFAASHIIHGHPGKCANLHGHNWKVEVTAVATEVNDIGIGIDFCDLKGALKQIIERLDHQHLNDVKPFDQMNPTAENLAKYIYQEMLVLLPSNVSLEHTTLWETDRSRVRYQSA